jgi:sugar lactone lactonase YvrE
MTRLGSLALSATLLTAAVVGPAGAQDDAAARSQAAREAYRRAAAAERAGQADSAYAEVSRAQRSWPEQPAYTEQLARMAARRGDIANLDRALAQLARQGTGGAAALDSAVRRVAGASSGIAARLRALDSALAPVEGATSRLVTGDTAFWPEGLDVDPRDGALLVTSIRHRNVLRVAPDGATRWLLADSARPAAVMGVAVDAVRDLLWLTTAGHRAMSGFTAADTAASELLLVRGGRIARRWRLGDGTGIPGELAVAPDGEVVVSDAVKGRLYRLTPGAESLVTLAHPLLRSAQGIAFSADGGTAWIADWSHGLLRWERATGEISAVTAADGATLVGIDGLRRVGERLLGVQNGVSPARVIEIALSPDGRRASKVRVLDRPGRLDGEPTVGAIVGGNFVYVASSHWPFWSDDLRRLGPSPLPPVTLRAVPLGR